MQYYKVTKLNGKSLYQNCDIIYTEGLELTEPNYDGDPKVECARGIYVCNADQLPLWWQRYPTAIWTAEIIGEFVAVAKGFRCKSVRIGRKLSCDEIRSLVPGWHERSQITDRNNVTQTAGDGSTQKAGDGSTQTAGYGSTQTAGYGSTQTAGYGSTQTAGYGSTQTAGYGSTQTAGDGSTQTAGYGSTQTAGDGSTQTAGHRSTQTAGYGSTQTAGYGSTQTAGDGSTQKAGDDSTQKAGINSVQIGYWFDGYSYKVACRVVTSEMADKPFVFSHGEWKQHG